MIAVVYFLNTGLTCDATTFHVPCCFTKVSVHTNFPPRRFCFPSCALIVPCPTTIAVSPYKRTCRSSILNSVKTMSPVMLFKSSRLFTMLPSGQTTVQFSASRRCVYELSPFMRASAQSCWILVSACSSSDLFFMLHDRLPGERTSQTWHESLDPTEHELQEMRIRKFRI